MNSMNRRRFLGSMPVAGLVLGTIGQPLRAAPAPPQRKMTLDLTWGAIGVSANQRAAIELAAKHGFESVAADAGFLARLSPDELASLKGEMKGKGIVFGAAGLPVDFRGEADRFAAGVRELPGLSAGLERAGVDRVGTWLTPADDRLTYLQNLKQHATRLRRVAEILKDNGQRLGLEYVGTHTSRIRRKFPFVHTMAETKELIAEIGTGNVGLVLDSWHWWQAGDTVEDIRTLTKEQIVAVDLNDAPAGLAKEEQLDNRRELPAATGVIEVSSFLQALQAVGYDGPVRAEPFNQPLNAMGNDEACAATIGALRKAFKTAGLAA